MLSLNPEVQRLAYSGIRQEDCEGTSCSSTLGEASVDASRLTLVGFCALLECLTWWLQPRRWATSTAEGLGVSEMVSITCAEAVSSFMLLCETWGSDPEGKSWGPGSSESSCQAYLCRGMLED